MRLNVCLPVGLPKTDATFVQEKALFNLASLQRPGKRATLRDPRGVAIRVSALVELDGSIGATTNAWRRNVIWRSKDTAFIFLSRDILEAARRGRGRAGGIWASRWRTEPAAARKGAKQRCWNARD